MGPADSTVVVCAAYDPDGDRLVYDWITDARLKIKGNPPNYYRYFNAFSDSMTFYPGPAMVYPTDTAWVQCFARDGRGMSDARIINILVHH
jgi:hypothetical protein